MKNTKETAIGITATLFSLAAVAPAHAYTCDDYEGRMGSTTYFDSTLADDYRDRTGDDDPEIQYFWVMNSNTYDRIDDVQLLLFCPYDDGDLVARTVRGPNIPLNDAARFEIPWPEKCRLQVEVRFEKGSNDYHRISDSEAFTYDEDAEEYGHPVNGVQVNDYLQWNHWTLHNCQ